MSARKQNRRKPRRFEQLEDRRLMAVVLGESTFSVDQMGENLDAYFAGNVVGYGYAINRGGSNVIEGTGFGGQARTPADGGPIMFQATTKTEIASVSKVITATAVLKLLEDTTPDVDAALATPLVDYLPSDWNPGANVDGITLRMLLTHRSGLMEETNPAGINFGSFGNNTMQNLKSLVEGGVNSPTRSPDATFDNPYWNYSYNNANFSLLAKVVIPKLIFPNANFTAANFGGYDQLNQTTGTFYKAYVNDNVLEPAGVFGADLDVDETDATIAKGYDWPNPANAQGYSQSDMTGTGGAFGWKLSPIQVTRFGEALDTNEIISAQTRQLMYDQQLGIFRGTNDFGNFYGHNGLANSSDRQFRSKLEILPGGIQTAVQINSNDDGLPDADGNGSPDSVGQLVQSAYINAWTDIVFEGDDGDNVFEIRTDFSGSKTTVDLYMDGDLVLSQWASTLDSLTVNGLGGDDEFRVHQIPGSVSVTINGNAGADELIAGATFNKRNMELYRNLTFNGGSGLDDVTIRDQNNPYSHALSRVYYVSSTGVSRIAALNPGQPQIPYGVGVSYSSASLNLQTGASSDVVRVSSTGGVSTIDTGAGNDTVILAENGKNLDAVAGLTVDGGDGFNTLIAHDDNNPYASPINRNYTINDEQISRFRAFPHQGQPNQIALPPIPLIVGHENMDVLNVHTGNGSDHIVVGGNGSDALLYVNANDGADQIFVDGAAFAQMNLNGGNPTPDPDDTILLPGGGASIDVLTMTADDDAVGSWSPSKLHPGQGGATIDDAEIAYWDMERVYAEFPHNDDVGDFNHNGVVEAGDLHDQGQGWQSRFGKDLDGGGFLAWQRNMQPTKPTRPTGPDKFAPKGFDPVDPIDLTAIDAFFARESTGIEAKRHYEAPADPDETLELLGIDRVARRDAPTAPRDGATDAAPNRRQATADPSDPQPWSMALETLTDAVVGASRA